MHPIDKIIILPTKTLRQMFACVLCITSMGVVSVEAETLQDAMSLAYRTNPALLSQRAQVQATGELKPQAFAALLPQINAQAGYTKLDTEQISPAGAAFDRNANLDQLSYSASLEQVLFSGGRGLFSIRQATAQIDTAQAELLGIEQQLLTNVATAYFDVVRDVQIHRVNQVNVEVLRRQRVQAQQRFASGELARTDIAQADARFAAARAVLANAKAQLNLSRSTYRQLVGQAPGSLQKNTGLPVIPDSLEKATMLAQEVAPGVIVARAAERASRHGVKIARSDYFPRVTASAAYQFQDEPSTFIDQSENISYGVRLEVPLFRGGAQSSRVRQAKAMNKSDRFKIYQAEREVMTGVISAWEQLAASKFNIAAAQDQVTANQLAVDGVKKEALVGSRTTLEVLNAQLEFMNAQLALINATHDMQVAHYSLLSSIGILTHSSARGPAVIPSYAKEARAEAGQQRSLNSVPLDVVQQYGLPDAAHQRLVQEGQATTLLATSYQLAASPQLYGKWHADLRGGIAHSVNRDGENNDTYTVVEVGPRYQGSTFDAAVRVTADKRRFGDKDYLRSAGLKLLLTKSLSKRFRFSVHSSFKGVKYETDNGRNGDVYAVGGAIERDLGQHSSLRLGAQISRQDADAVLERNTQARLSGSLVQNLPWGFKIRITPELLQRRFNSANTTNSRREDTTSGVSVSVLNRKLDFMGFLPIISYHYLENNSTDDFYDYKLSTADISLARAL